MSSPSDLIAGAAFRSDQQDTNRVLQSEWVALYNQAVNSTWDTFAAARPDFQVASFDVSLASGGSASFQVPYNFHSIIDLVYGPDTSQEYSLGPFNWQNRRSPGGWYWPTYTGYGAGPGGTSMRLMGWLIYVEPSRCAFGAYRLWFCPKPHVCQQTVRLATAAALPTCTAAGSGVGKTLTATGTGALVVDGIQVLINDKILVKNQAASGDDGVYVVTSPGSISTTWTLKRQPGYDVDATIFGGMALGDICAVAQSDAALPVGLTNEGKFFTLTVYTAIESAQTWTEGATIEPILERFVEILMLKMAIPALKRDNRQDVAKGFETTLMGPALDGNGGLMKEAKWYFAQNRGSTISQLIDTDAQMFRGGGGWNGL